MSIFNKNSAQTYKRLLSYVKSYWKLFGLSLIAMILLASTEWMLPALLKPLIDHEFNSPQNTFGYSTPIFLVLLFLIRGTLSYLATVSLHLVAQKTIADLRFSMFENLIRLPNNFFDKKGSGSIVSKFNYDVTQVAQAATRVITVLVKDFTVIVVLLTYLLYLNYKLAIFLFLLAPPVGFLVSRISLKMRVMSGSLQDSIGDITQNVEETIRGQKEVKIFEGYAREELKFGNSVKAAKKFQMKVVRASAALVPLIQVIVAFGIAGMIVLALDEAGKSNITRGEFIAFVTATALLLPPIKRLASANEFLQRGIAAADSVFSLIDQPREFIGGERSGNQKGSIIYKDVSFSYAEKKILKNINFEIDSGQTLAIVGPSGSGKTTLVSLLPKFYGNFDGNIIIDGIDSKEYGLKNLRNLISFVGQDTFLFNDTIYNNVVYGSENEVSVSQFDSVIISAQLADFVASCPNGKDTVVGENGVRLSGGQKQRIAIARALLKNAPILVLDEATASLDNTSEVLIQKALRNLSKNKTNIVIAHRLSTIVKADKIIVLDSGEIAESGTHDSLLAGGGLYSSLYKQSELG